MEQVAQFRILNKIGAGGMGEVYRARDEKLQRDVAIKVLPVTQFEDATSRARLLREARSAAALNHPNICVIHEVGEAGSQAFIAMECVEGEPLSARLARSPLTHAEVIRFGIQLADALAHAHDHGVVHRDLKPQNIIVTPQQRLKVLDFGLAKRLFDYADPGESTDVMVTAHGVIQGTPAYMSPEQLRGLPADERSDIWAMGVILHEMAARKRPFEGNTWPELSASILSLPPQPLPADVPAELTAIINRCLEKEPGNRYRSAAEVRSALEIIQSTAVGSRAVALPRSRTGWGAASVAAAVVVIAVVVGFNLKLNVDRFKDWSSPTTTPAAAAKLVPAVVDEAKEHAVAVLPFSSFSGVGEEYLADGMQDAIIGELARVRELRVMSRTSTMTFRNAKKSAADIANTLGVANVIEGSVARAGDRIRVQVKLIRTAPEERQIWAEAYDRDMRDVLSLYGEIAAAVATQIDSRLAASVQAVRAQVASQVDPEIYKLYLRGMYQLHKGGEEGFKAGIALMREAMAIDPADPLPYAGLAQAYALRVHDGIATPEDIELAKASAKKATRAGVGLAEVYGAIGLVAQYGDWDWSAAKQNFERALELNPSLAEIRRHHAWYLMTQNRREEALTEMRRARDTEPLNGDVNVDIGWILASLNRPAEGLPDVRKALELAPENPYVLMSAGFAFAQNGMYKEALEVHRKLMRLYPEMVSVTLPTLVLAGERKEADTIIEALRKSKSPDAAYGLAQAYCALGNNEEALRWVVTARDRHFVYAPWAHVDAALASIHNDPRFKKMVASMKLPV